jgi:hypothetical protein
MAKRTGSRVARAVGASTEALRWVLRRLNSCQRRPARPTPCSCPSRTRQCPGASAAWRSEGPVVVWQLTEDVVDLTAVGTTRNFLGRSPLKYRGRAQLGKPVAGPSPHAELVRRLQAVPNGASARLSYAPLTSPGYEHGIDIQVIGVDADASTFRFMSAGLSLGVPIGDLEMWRPDDTSYEFRVTGYITVDATAPNGRRYYSRGPKR